MAEVTVKRRERALVEKTVGRLDRENFCCAIAVGKLAEVASVVARDKGGTKIIKSVYHGIDRVELDRLLHFDGFSDQEAVILEIWLWEPRAREPFKREKLFYNRSNQRLDSDFEEFVK